MNQKQLRRTQRTACVLASMLASQMTLAQMTPAPAAGSSSASSATPASSNSNSVSVNAANRNAIMVMTPQVAGRLLELLVENGALTRQQADALLLQAQQAAPQSSTVTPSTTSGVITVPYIPELVRNQIKEQLREEVTTKAREEGWAAPNALPEWTKRLVIAGDVRVRGEKVNFQDALTKIALAPQDPNDPNSPQVPQLVVVNPLGNYNLFPNVNAINSGTGFDFNGTSNPPFLNTTEDRQRLRLRARVGIDAKISDGVTAGIRIATGSDNSPVSTNQTLGGGAEFGKYQLWLDRAYIHLQPVATLAIDAGRTSNPFWTSDLLFDDDLNVDGLSLSWRHPDGNFNTFATAGAFPYFNTAFNVGNTSIAKDASRDRYLYAAQLGFEWNYTGAVGLRTALGYFNFSKAEGVLSSPCLDPQTTDTCDSDSSRPQFVQQGNTLFTLRQITHIPPATAERQYLGLASKFRIANAHVETQWRSFDPVVVRLEFDYVKNLAFDKEAIQTLEAQGRIVTNLGAVPATSIGQPVQSGPWEGGDTGYMATLAVGRGTMKNKHDWKFSAAYRHLESDAVMDAFTDSDFHLGGTNSKGYVMTAEYGIATNTRLGVRLLSADEITGPPLQVDILQLDLAARF